ncbi:MAG TPA: AI-2E family transporter [Bryobacteraceae bacterium]|nr:AI-2E family transporter [Bryobacteraceae bacterium]
MSSLTSGVSARKGSSVSTRVLAVAATIALLYFGRVFFITIVIAGIIAFLLDPLVSLVAKLHLPRPLASFVVCSVSLFAIYLLGVGIYTEFAGLVEDLPMYSDRINKLADDIGSRIDAAETRTYQLIVPKRFQDQPAATQAQPITPARGRRRTTTPAAVVAAPPIQEVRIHSDPKPLYSFVYGYVRSFYDIGLMASFVPFLIYFMLSWRDHLKRSFLRLFTGEEQRVAWKSWEGVAAVARVFVVGNFVLALVVGFFTSVFLFAIRLPYWPLIGPLSGFLSMVPYVGLPLAIIPALLAGLAVYDAPAIYLLMAAVIAFLHLIAMNLLYPKMVGARVHLNPLAVTIALMFWGTLWGAVGLILAIPITAGLKAVCDNLTNLEGYGKLLGD